LNIETGERVETELDGFIANRDKQRRKTEGERAREELYMVSVRTYHERETRQRWWERLRFHEGQVRRHTATLEALKATTAQRRRGTRLC
jgi:hypothetical protein